MPVIFRNRDHTNARIDPSVVADEQQIEQLLKDRWIELLQPFAEGEMPMYVRCNGIPWSELFEQIVECDNDEDEVAVDTADANCIGHITFDDPDSKLPVELTLFKDTRSGGLFAIDSSFLESEDDKEAVPSPFHAGVVLRLKGL